jgi:hypothetical protein
MSHGANERKPLLNFSETQERASLIDTDFEEDSMARKRKGRKSKKGKRVLVGIKRKGVKLNKGRLKIRVAGYQGVQSLTASELVRHIPLSKLRAAAKKVLKRSGAGKTKRKGKKRGRKRKRKH